MADQRVLDDSENDESTKIGASVQGSHHDAVLGHILEDISLEEWDITPPDILASESSVSEIAESSEIAELSEIAESSETTDSSIQPPKDEWIPAKIPEPPPAAESSLFSFSLMQKFGEAMEPSSSELAPTASELQPGLPPESPPTAPELPSESPVSSPLTPVTPELVPAPPIAIGPNPFLIKLAPVVETIAPIAAASSESVPETPSPAPSPAAAPSPSVSPSPTTTTSHPAIPNPTAPALPGAASTRIPALAPTAAMNLAQAAKAMQMPAPVPVAPPAVPPVTSSPAVTPTAPNGASTAANAPGKRKPAATLIFDSFTKSKIAAAGIDIADPFNLNSKAGQVNSPPNANADFGASSTQAPLDLRESAPPKQRNTARTLIFKAGMPLDGLDHNAQPITNPAQNVDTTTGSHPTVSANPSLGPNLAAAIAAYQTANPNAIPTAEATAARANSNVIPAHSATSAPAGVRTIARTMIMKTLAKPEPTEVGETTGAHAIPPTDGRPSDETIIAAGQAAEAEEAQATETGRPKIAKRSTAPTLIFKAFTLPSPEENAKPAPLKIIRYDSSKLRNLETNVKPISIAESMAAAKQASLGEENKNDRRPQWVKVIAAHPLLKSPLFRSATLLLVLSSALLVCSSALIKSLYSDGQEYHPTNASAARDQHHFKSTDGGKSFELSDKDKGSVFIQNGKTIRGKIKNVSDTDLVSLVTSPVPKREIWLQKTDAGYVDQDGTILYSASAPELIIAKKIDTYANLVAAKYKETKLYPSDIERLERISPKEFRYTNPFTGKVDQPTVQYKRFAAADAGWTDRTRAGNGWAEEAPFKAGSIHCICLDYCRFFIRGFDRNGHPLYGSAPGAADYVELKDGQNMNPHQVNAKVADDKDKTPATFCVTRSSALPLEVAVLRQTGPALPIVIIVLLVGCGAWLFILRKMKSSDANSTARTTKFITK